MGQIMEKNIPIIIDDEEISTEQGVSVAAAILKSGASPFRRSPENGEPRAPHCFMGVCCECLVEIDGVADRYACLEPVRENMQIKRQIDVVAPPTYPSYEKGSQS